MKIKVIERVRTMGNNSNKENKNYIFNLNNNIHKFQVNNNHQTKSNDRTQTPMLIINQKNGSGTFNSLFVLDNKNLKNKEQKVNVLII